MVTTDALHCHRRLAEGIVQRGGDYALAVKDNQPALLRDAKALIAAAQRRSRAKPATSKDAGHGRKEQRTALVACLFAALSIAARCEQRPLSAVVLTAMVAACVIWVPKSPVVALIS